MRFIRCPIWEDEKTSITRNTNICPKGCTFLSRGDKVAYYLYDGFDSSRNMGTFVELTGSVSIFGIPRAIVKRENDDLIEKMSCMLYRVKFNPNDIEFYTREIDVQ